MLIIRDHYFERESTILSNLRNINKELSRNHRVVICHCSARLHGRYSPFLENKLVEERIDEKLDNRPKSYVTDKIDYFVLNDYSNYNYLNFKNGIHEDCTRFNPSYLKIGRKLYIILRRGSYAFPFRRIVAINSGINKTISYNEVYDYKTLSFVREILNPYGNSKFLGYEDCRAGINQNNEIIISACDVNEVSNKEVVTDSSKTAGISIIKLNKDFSEEIIHKKLLVDNIPEKNWQLIEGTDLFVYCYNPFTLIRINDDSSVEKINPKSINVDKKLRGSTNFIKYNNGYIGLSHSKIGNSDYYHCILELDSEFNLIRSSKYFKFLDEQIEFCSSIYKFKDHVGLLVGIFDAVSVEFKLSFELIENLLSSKLTEVEKSKVNLLDDCSSENYLIGKLVFSDKSKKSELIKEVESSNFSNEFKNQIIRKLNSR